ncbi:ESX secretion-associated protein EspG [Saccharopolyspora taberi]|uniref:ESX secretion-associated protein EspG n=1 Tax=Saccharopolyspora taberi TaxID=60895 RepID=A0ABN3VGF0_9PSEU
MKIELSTQAFHEVWKHFNLGAKPIVLNVLSEGVLESERRAAEQRAWDELRRIGFGDRDREDDIHGLFLPLQRYERAFDITFRQQVGDEQRQVTGMVANVRSHATLAVRTDTSVQLQALPAEAMVRALLSVLPDAKAGPGRAVSVASSTLAAVARAAGSSDRAMADGLGQSGVRREDARALVEMAGGKRTAWAQIGVSVMDGHGKRTRGPMVTNCFANAKGWYLLEESTRSGEPWTTVAPIDKARIGPRVENLLKVIPRD